MIHYTKGDLLKSDAQALVNTVNTVGVMGKGIALQFKERYPVNYTLYRDACKAKKVRVGEMFITTERSLSDEKIIINFPTKTTWRKPSEYSYIEEGLKSLKSEILSRKISSVAIPPLGSHNGGLDWLRVKKMIEETLSDLDCVIYLYEPSDIIIERLKEERVKLTPARAMMLDVLCDMVSYGEFISVFAAEKIVYFLQRLGAKSIFNIEYVKYYYGPYSKGKVSHVLYYLNGSYIKGMGGMQVKPFDELWMLPETPSAVKEYLSQKGNEEYRAISEKTKDFLRGYYSALSLEMLSTVDFILQNELKNWKTIDANQLYDEVNAQISAWSTRKNQLFAHSAFLPNVIEHLSEIKN